VLKLDYTSLDDKGVEFLKTLPHLRELSLDATNLTDKGAEGLQAMAGLKALNLYHTLVTEKGLQSLKAVLPQCAVVFDRDSALPTRRAKSE